MTAFLDFKSRDIKLEAIHALGKRYRAGRQNHLHQIADDLALALAGNMQPANK